GVGAQVGVVGQVDAPGQAGAHVQLPHGVAVHLQHGGGQAVEQVVQEHGPERPRAAAGDRRIPQQVGTGIQGVGQAQQVAAGVVGEDAVAASVHQHLLGAIRCYIN